MENKIHPEDVFVNYLKAIKIHIPTEEFHFIYLVFMKICLT